MELYPLMFRTEGMTQPYLWGGQKLRQLGFTAPGSEPIAEIWLVSDRPQDQRVSMIANGPLAGQSLHWLMAEHRSELLGESAQAHKTFPLLIKLLDARERLSLQVHPPAEIARQLGGEPKTESWIFLAETDPGAQVFAGLRAGVTKKQLVEAVASGQVETLLHKLSVNEGDCLWLPAGRLHAIDAGCLLLEIQENSNTTYRVFDWNRLDPATGQSRQLHRSQALQSINFNDFEPALQAPTLTQVNGNRVERLVTGASFNLERWQIATSARLAPGSCEILVGLDSMTIKTATTAVTVLPYRAVLIPAEIDQYEIMAPTRVMRTFVA